jgi:hypothetical protein
MDIHISAEAESGSGTRKLEDWPSSTQHLVCLPVCSILLSAYSWFLYFILHMAHYDCQLSWHLSVQLLASVPNANSLFLYFFLSFFFVLGVHCGIYKGSYNISNISYSIHPQHHSTFPSALLYFLGEI